MILNDFIKTNNSFPVEIDELSRYKTKDGSLSLYSSNYKEAFHSNNGAIKESINKYLKPAQLDRLYNTKKISILDVCIGMGYNTGCFLEILLKRGIQIDWHGLEIDQRPLKIALQEMNFIERWSPKVLSFFDSIKRTGEWNDGINKGIAHWGEARKKINEINNSVKFDVILLDPFSPSKCPELWSEEFLSLLSKKLSHEGRLITYSRAASVRGSLKRAGLEIYSLKPVDDNTNQWSSGTVAMKNPIKEKHISNNQQFKDLSQREMEHLETRAAIPYRDPSGVKTSREILFTRTKEQLNSSLKSTSDWRKRWDTAK